MFGADNIKMDFFDYLRKIAHFLCPQFGFLCCVDGRSWGGSSALPAAVLSVSFPLPTQCVRGGAPWALQPAVGSGGPASSLLNALH